MGKQNIGTINALVRITLGFFFLAYGSVRATRRPWSQRYWLIIMASAMKIAEGIVRYCPVTDMVKQQIDARIPFNLFDTNTNSGSNSNSKTSSSSNSDSKQTTTADFLEEATRGNEQ
ncbi:YgaP family membrane protein [Alkalibacillus aidingensis]|uniref:YgaP family membrane protein n=1 Tax=Alkalibacillus aidingensis TaxID=2747607 RepID=UPI001660D6B8|nr:DUF2892 domain-containing protein [Alkalibacillus aidingensis]